MRSVVLALLIPAAALVPLVSAGQASLPRVVASDAGLTFDPDNVTAMSQYMATLVKGNALYAKQDFTGAIDTYKQAIQLGPRNPLGIYLLGEAYLASKNLPEAEAAFLLAEETSDSKNPVLRSHVLFAVADVFERGHKPREAAQAWRNYLEHASSLADGGAFPASGTERLRVVEALLEREKSDAIVRERIANEREAGAARQDAGARR